MRVLVLGSGPAGLMAAQGVVDAGFSNKDRELEVKILSRKVKSPLYGAQYLHQPIPNFTQENGHAISYQMRGDVDEYRRKVYGQMYDGQVSPEDLAGQHMGWDIRETYDRLWDFWEGYIGDLILDPVNLSSWLSIATQRGEEYDLIINSIPRPALCHAGHTFRSTEVWAAGDAPELGITLQYKCLPFTVVCNGDDSPAWYRLSNVFGRTTVEWPGSLERVPVNTASKVKKPLDHHCACWSDAPMIHVGRYGEWCKGVLSHTAYFKAYKKVDEMMGARSAAAEAGA